MAAEAEAAREARAKVSHSRIFFGKFGFVSIPNVLNWS